MRTTWAISKSEGICLEIGCNTGQMTMRLAENCYVVSGDVNARLARGIKRKTVLLKISANIMLFDAHNLPFRNGSFDTVLMIDVLEHLKNPNKALKEAKRVGRKKILVNIPNYDFATGLYPNMLPEHFKEPSHLHLTNVKMLSSWLKQISFTKINMFGSYVPLPLPLIPFSYLLEYLSKRLHIKPARVHFQISCELFL